MSVAKPVAGMITARGGIDAIVFTGGIGELDAPVRALDSDHLSWFGMHIYEAANDQRKDRINTVSSRSALHILSSQEDEQIAWHTGYLVTDHALAKPGAPGRVGASP